MGTGDHFAPAPLWLPSHNPTPSSSSSAVSGCLHPPTLVCRSVNPNFPVSQEWENYRFYFTLSRLTELPSHRASSQPSHSAPKPCRALPAPRLLSKLLQIITRPVFIPFEEQTQHGLTQIPSQHRPHNIPRQAGQNSPRLRSRFAGGFPALQR